MSDERPPARGPAGLGGGVRVGSVLGVPLVVSPLWFLIVVVLTVGLAPQVRDQVHPPLSQGASYSVALLFVLLLYGSVLVHELAHVVVARMLGLPVGRIVLQLLGGVSEVLREPETAGREFLVAAVGPLTSVLLGGIGAAVAAELDPHTVPGLVAAEFAFANGVVAAFNLLPGLPLDGGRVLRAILWQLTHDKVRGSLVAGWIGRGLALVLAGVAVAEPRLVVGDRVVGPFYFLILAFFVWTNASMAINQAKVSGALPRLDLQAMTRRALPVAPDLPVAEAVRRARDVGARALVVVDSLGHPSGIVAEAAVSALPPQRQPWVPVSDVSRPVEAGIVLRSDMSGSDLLAAVQTTPSTEYLVTAPGGAVLGVLARADIVAALQAAGVR